MSEKKSLFTGRLVVLWLLSAILVWGLLFIFIQLYNNFKFYVPLQSVEGTIYESPAEKLKRLNAERASQGVNKDWEEDFHSWVDMESLDPGNNPEGVGGSTEGIENDIQFWLSDEEYAKVDQSRFIRHDPNPLIIEGWNDRPVTNQDWYVENGWLVILDPITPVWFWNNPPETVETLPPPTIDDVLLDTIEETPSSSLPEVTPTVEPSIEPVILDSSNTTIENQNLESAPPEGFTPMW